MPAFNFEETAKTRRCVSQPPLSHGRAQEDDTHNNRYCVPFQATCGVVSAVSDCLSLFSLFRFLAGAGTIGCILVRFVYCIEMVVTAHRSWVGIVNMMFLSFGSSLLCLLAYLIPNWRHLMLAVSLPGFLPLLAWW